MCVLARFQNVDQWGVNLADCYIITIVSATIRINYESESIYLQLSLIGVQMIQVGRMLKTILHLEIEST